MSIRPTGIPRFVRILVFWLILIFWPFLLRLIPPLKFIPFLAPVAFIQMMFLINIPGLPLARAYGLPHFEIEEFGAIPKDAAAYAMILLFWIVIALLLSAVTNSLMTGASRRRKIGGKDSADVH